MGKGGAHVFVLMGLTGLAWLLGAAAASAADMQLSAASGLRDGQIITVNVSGFSLPDPGQLTLLQCRPSARASSDCDPTTLDVLVTNGDGTGSAPYALKLRPGICDQATACAIFAVENPLRFDNADPQSRFATAPVLFGPSAGGVTPPPAPSGPSAAPAPAPFLSEPLPSPTATTLPLPPPPGTGTQSADEPPPSIPEVPWGLLLPFGAAATFGGAVMAARNRALPDYE